MTTTTQKIEIHVDGKLLGFVRTSGAPSRRGVQFWIAEDRSGKAVGQIEPTVAKAAAHL